MKIKFLMGIQKKKGGGGMLPKEEQKSDSKVTEDNSASFSEF